MALRLRLTLITTVVLAVVLAIFGAGVYVLLDRNLRSRVDARIQQRAVEVARAMRFGAGSVAFRDLGFGRPDTYIQIVSLDGDVVDRSEALGTAELPIGATVRAVGSGRHRAATVDAVVGTTPLRMRAFPLVDALGQPAGTLLIAARLDDVFDTLHRLRTLMLLAGLAGIGLAAALGWRSARTALRPVEEIGATAHEIGVTGDLSRRVTSGRTDELGRLADAFNTMLDRLEGAQSELSRTVETQRRFVDDASHELRTPLTIMRGNLELVARDPGMAAEDRVAALRDAIEEAERMSRLVDDLLALARVDAGMAMPDTDVELGRLVQGVAHGARPAAGDRTLSVAVGAEGTRVRGSEPLIRRLLENLVDNAVKYTSPSGKIAIALREEGPDAVLTVADDGIGMNPEELAHVFDRFWRSDSSRERPGSGLGLSIAKAVAEAHRGSIEAKSEAGVGTTFTVRLPVLREDAPSAQPQVPTAI
jgi:two-component system, OmpR family, sensor kinase